MPESCSGLFPVMSLSVLGLSRSVLISSSAAWRGSMALRPLARQPAQTLQLYDIEACPYCRLVRETLTELDLDVQILPCPKNGQRFRPQAEALGGKAQFPLLHDPNTGRTLYESATIIEYLGQTYGGSIRATRGIARQLKLLGSMLGSGLQAPAHGMRARPSRAPQQALILYSFESSPYSRPVREWLCELELPYLLHNTGKARLSDLGPPAVRDRLLKADKGTSRNRKALLERTGRVQVPYLIDPNTGVEMFESAAILAYLRKTYAA